MNRVFIFVLCGAMLTACSPSRAPEAIAQYNLSKGKCVEIPYCREDNCRILSEKMTLGDCQMVGGKFIPRNHKKLYWF